MPSLTKSYRVIFSSSNLKKIYEEHVAKTSAIGIDRINRSIFERNLASEVALIRRKSGNRSYRFSQFKEKLISKGANRYPRVISIATFRDRVTLRALCDILKARFEDALELKIPQIVIHNLKEEIASGKYKFFVKLDVQNFYPSISHTILRAAVKQRIKSTKILSLVNGALETPTVAVADKSKKAELVGVPQGLSISNILAEIFLHQFDRGMEQKQNVKYFRYVDDVFALCTSNPVPLFTEMSSVLQSDFDLKVHDIASAGSKSAYGPIDDEFSFLGYLFLNGKARVKEQSIQRLESSLADAFTTYKYRCQEIRKKYSNKKLRRQNLTFARNILIWRVNLRITGCVFEGTRKGWVFYFSQIDDSSIEQLHKLDKTVESLMRRFNVATSKKLCSFVRVYFECRRRDPTESGYIPNFDTTSVVNMRRILENYFGRSVKGLSDASVRSTFAVRIRRATRELEQDIQDIS
ncbi:reverse transcriptase domain-containing protein [Burkholderia guangdongensis]|uniref:reverse transcriptase domain-containing protein n=1 Tax=Burkholderia guangdongensis TaxID=1792500 RepID=UPI0015C96504|nr:reverse transcriptase domain-containing protein [Burkholderia guangdongensis]